MLFKWIQNKLNLATLWEDIFTVDRSFFRRMMIALVIALAGFGLISILFEEISIITIVFYCGFFIGLFYGFILSIAVDYFFIPPFGILFKYFAGNERLFIIVLIAILAKVSLRPSNPLFKKLFSTYVLKDFYCLKKH